MDNHVERALAPLAPPIARGARLRSEMATWRWPAALVRRDCLPRGGSPGRAAGARLPRRQPQSGPPRLRFFLDDALHPQRALARRRTWAQAQRRASARRSRAGGFTRVHRAVETPLNLVLEARPW